MEVDSRGLVLSNANCLSGFYVGGDRANTGTLVVGGLGSVLSVTGGAGYAPYGAVGRDGGAGTALISGGAQLMIDSAHASDPALAVNTAGTSLSATAGTSGVAGSIVIGGGGFTSGTLHVGAGASVSSDGVVGVAYNNGSLAGSGRLVVNGTGVAPNVIVGSSGSLGGSGLIAGKLTNYGVISPGNSPGTLPPARPATSRR